MTFLVVLCNSGGRNNGPAHKLNSKRDKFYVPLPRILFCDLEVASVKVATAAIVIVHVTVVVPVGVSVGLTAGNGVTHHHTTQHTGTGTESHTSGTKTLTSLLLLLLRRHLLVVSLLRWVATIAHLWRIAPVTRLRRIAVALGWISAIPWASTSSGTSAISLLLETAGPTLWTHLLVLRRRLGAIGVATSSTGSAGIVRGRSNVVSLGPSGAFGSLPQGLLRAQVHEIPMFVVIVKAGSVAVGDCWGVVFVLGHDIRLVLKRRWS